MWFQNPFANYNIIANFWAGKFSNSKAGPMCYSLEWKVLHDRLVPHKGGTKLADAWKLLSPFLLSNSTIVFLVHFLSTRKSVSNLYCMAPTGFGKKSKYWFYFMRWVVTRRIIPAKKKRKEKNKVKLEDVQKCESNFQFLTLWKC